MKDFIFTVRQILSGNSVTRSFLNLRLSKDALFGKVMDIGGGHNPDYISFMKRDSSVEYVNFDVKTGALIDFEKDRLPAIDGTYDTVLFLNVMEHIFNHQHIMNEVVRITKSGGRLIGFVPFLMWYHPDHKDFFRYTHEALQIILNKSGVDNFVIEPIALGPFTAASQMVTQILPTILAIPIFATGYLIDSLYLRLRPKQKGRYALGYYFAVTR